MPHNIGLFSTKLSPALALEMALLSKEAYEARPDKGAPDTDAVLASLKQRDTSYERVKGNSETNAQASILCHKGFLALAFHGTDQLTDWPDNFDGRRANSEVGTRYFRFQSNEDIVPAYLLDLWATATSADAIISTPMARPRQSRTFGTAS